MGPARRLAVCLALVGVGAHAVENAIENNAPVVAPTEASPLVTGEVESTEEVFMNVPLLQTTRRALSSSNKAYKGSRQSLSSVPTWRLAIATALVLCLGSLAAGAGVGGGGLFVPIYWLILGVGPKAAVPLSKATILGGAIGNFVSIGFQKHPVAKQRPLIDYEAATFMQSGELLGVVFGVLFNMILPEICIIVFLAAILSYNAVRTLRKGLRTRAKETKKALADEKSAASEKDASNDEGVAATPSDDDDDDDDKEEDDDDAKEKKKKKQEQEMVMMPEESKEAAFDDGPDSYDALERAKTIQEENEELLKEVEKDESTQFPMWAWAQLLPMTLFLTAYTLCKAFVFTPCVTWDLTERKGHADKGFAGPLFWLWYWTPLPVYVGFMVRTSKILKSRTARRDRLVEAGLYEYLPNDLHWTSDFLLKFPKVALLAGVAAGLLGIGGGMVIGPLFMAIDMEPQVGTSTCAFMILFTATAGVILYLFSGLLSWQLMLWCIAFGFVSGQLGQRGVNYVLKKTGRPSYVILLLAGIIASACVSMTISGAWQIGTQAAKGKQIFYIALAEFRCGLAH